jgi:hypothetical protein
MLRDVAVTRIQDGLGFSSRQSDKIILRLQEAQRELEMGKTLPKFLLQEQTIPLTLPVGQSLVALPTGFLRMDEDNPPHYTSPTSGLPVYVSVKRAYRDAFEANFSGESEGPKVVVILKNYLSFINPADTTYTLAWNWYKAADELTSNIENEWLANAPEWLIGEAGWRMAMDVRDKDAVTIFDNMRKTARASVLGEILASDDASGPLVMGANL